MIEGKLPDNACPKWRDRMQKSLRYILKDMSGKTTKTDNWSMILFQRILDKTFEGSSANDMIK